MTSAATSPKVDARSLAQLMSNAGFKHLMTGSKRPGYIRRMKRYVGWESARVLIHPFATSDFSFNL